MATETRFDLEGRIMMAWQTSDDLEDILHAHFDSEKGPLSQDQLMNTLQGIQTFHNIRMQRLWETFERIIKDKSFEPMTEEEITKIKNDDFEGSMQ